MPYERGHPQRSGQGLVEDPKRRQEERLYRRIAGSAAQRRALATNQRRKTAETPCTFRDQARRILSPIATPARHASRGPSSANLSNTLAVQQWACPGCPWLVIDAWPVGLNLLADAELLAYLPEVMTTTLLKRLKLRKRFISWRRHFGETISHHRRVNPRSGKPQSS
jgi:hypothetical protein